MCVAGRTRESPIPGSTRGERGSALWLSLSLLLYRLGLDQQRPAFLAVMMVGMYLKVAPEIRRALQGGGPVVALEGTIITHGMPYPENLETARSLESQVRAGGVAEEKFGWRWRAPSLLTGCHTRKTWSPRGRWRARCAPGEPSRPLSP